MSRSDTLMVLGGMMFGVIVGLVALARPPDDMKLFLSDAITNPIVAHIHSLGAFLLDRVVSNAGSSAVIGGYDGWRLWMPEFLGRTPAQQ